MDSRVYLNKLIQSKFNSFQILGFGIKGLSYSRALAWLLNPQVNLNLDNDYLLNFLEFMYIQIKSILILSHKREKFNNKK